MTRFESSIIINQPREKVFAFATNFENNARWQTDVLKTEQTSQGPFGLGATYRCVNKFLGQKIETHGQVTAYEPGRQCSYKITSGIVTGETVFTFEPAGGGTKFTTSGRVDLSFFKRLKVFVERRAKQQLKNDLKRLKRIMENGS
jgi:uncharacterized membrane protein